MEFKTLVYIIIGAIWMLSKWFNSRQVQPPSGSEMPTDLPVPVPPRPSPGKLVPDKAMRRIPEKKVQVTKTVSKRPQIAAFSYEADQFVLPVQAEVADDPVNKTAVESSLAYTIGQEVSNGTMDFKKAFIVNELINRKYT
jgi:hypothetical protein